MALLSDLVIQTAPPESPILGDLDGARRVLDSRGIRYPEDYWELLARYGAGNFYEFPLMIEPFNPCLPDFAPRLAYVEDAKIGSASDGLFDSGHWVPLAQERERVLFANVEPTRVKHLAFVSLGSEDEYDLFDTTVTDFIHEYPHPSMQTKIWGDATEALSPKQLKFYQSATVSPPPPHWFELERRRFVDLARELDPFQVSIT